MAFDKLKAEITAPGRQAAAIATVALAVAILALVIAAGARRGA